MYDALTDVPGILVGHAQDDEAGTGCTVVLFPEGAVTGADVRGGAPGTREIDSLNPENIIGHIHAVYLGGGSAYGLDGVSGVMQFLEENEQGFDTGPARVPIVPGAVIFDLSAGSSSVRPDKAMGYKACGNASAAESRCGNLGAGTGASIGKALGDRFLMKGGLGTASISAGGITVGALVVVNCFGDILEPSSGRIVAGAWDREKKIFPGCAATMMRNPRSPAPVFQRNTTLGIIATNAELTKAQAKRIAMMAHDGLARTISPIHTMFDGDTIFCASSGRESADITAVGVMAAEVTARAVIKAVVGAEGRYGIPGYRDVTEK